MKLIVENIHVTYSYILYLKSPIKKNGRRDNALDVVMSSATSSSNVTMFGMHANNMSFATKKYMERYGLLPADTVAPEQHKDVPPRSDTPSDDRELGLFNVQQFLDLNEHSLCDRSVDNSENKTIEPRDTPAQQGNIIRPRMTNISIGGGSCGESSYHSGSRSSSCELGYTRQVSDSFNEFNIRGRRPASQHREHSTISDTTQYYSPDNTG